MSVGDAMTLFVAALVVIIGGRAVLRQTWNNWIMPIVSSVFAVAPPEITSSRAEQAVSEAVCPRTDDRADGRTEAISSSVKPATLDICKSLREHGYNRDEARTFLKLVDRTLGNDTWARAQPVDQPEIVYTPIAQRPVDGKWYPDRPDLEYKQPPDGA
jgi:hypothetical protein